MGQDFLDVLYYALHGVSLIYNNAGLTILTSLELLNYYLTLAISTISDFANYDIQRNDTFNHRFFLYY